MDHLQQPPEKVKTRKLQPWNQYPLRVASMADMIHAARTNPDAQITELTRIQDGGVYE
jgi:hypothetical protein